MEEELIGGNKENYGKSVIKNLSEELTKEFGKEYSERNLYAFVQFFKEFPEGHKEGYFARREKVRMPVAALVRPRENENRFEAYCRYHRDRYKHGRVHLALVAQGFPRALGYRQAAEDYGNCSSIGHGLILSGHLPEVYHWSRIQRQGVS